MIFYFFGSIILMPVQSDEYDGRLLGEEQFAILSTHAGSRNTCPSVPEVMVFCQRIGDTW